jgi:putative ABC transport system ATP-binding protein
LVNAPTVVLHKVAKSYDTPAGRYSALRDLDLEIGEGALVAITGKSGSGKSTLIHLIGGIDRATEGDVIVAGRKLSGLSEDALARWRGLTVGVVFQFFQLLPTLTTIENVMLPMDLCDVRAPGERRDQALRLLELVGIADQADKLPSTLSGGQQQRAAIARALANEPPVLIADEPTGNLDSATAKAVLAIFRELADRGTTVVIATHERDIATMSDLVVELADGRVAAQ